MTVYFEYVILDNFVIDYLLLKASHKIVGVAAKKRRLLFCAFSGALIALVYPIAENIPVISFLLKTSCGLILSLSSAKFRSLKEASYTVAVFFGLTFLSGGAIIGLFGLLGISYSSEISVAFMIVPAYSVIKGAAEIVSVIYKRRCERAFLYDIKLCLNGEKISAVGFMDTGNGVYDGDSPVVFCSKSVAERLCFSSFTDRVKLRRITVATVNGSEEKICFKLDRLEIYNGNEANIFNNVTACVSTGAAGIGYDVILHPALTVRDGAENTPQNAKTGVGL